MAPQNVLRTHTESGGLIDDSELPDLTRQKNLHLYELTSFDMLVLFLTMSGFLACFAKFNIRPVVIFCINLIASLIVRVFRSPVIQNIALCWSIMSYSFIITTQSDAVGPTMNYFWPIPFMFLLTGFRCITLFGMAVFVLIIHLFYIEFSNAMYFRLENRNFAVTLDIIFFFVNLFCGISIYILFFVLGQTTWRLRKHPGESLNSVPFLERIELITFSHLPMGLVLSPGNTMSDEQHLIILLRLAQHSPYRDLLLQLMRPKEQELNNIAGLNFTSADKRWIPLKTAPAALLSGPSRRLQLSTLLSEEQKLNTISSLEGGEKKFGGHVQRLGTEGQKIPIASTFQQYSLSGITIPIVGESRDTESTNLRQFLRSALMQLVLETHPNRVLCDMILPYKGFYYSRQQLEAALVSFNLRKKNRRRTGIYSPRLKVNRTVMPIWSSLDPRQRKILPSNYHKLLLPGILLRSHPIQTIKRHNTSQVQQAVTRLETKIQPSMFRKILTKIKSTRVIVPRSASSESSTIWGQSLDSKNWDRALHSSPIYVLEEFDTSNLPPKLKKTVPRESKTTASDGIQSSRSASLSNKKFPPPKKVFPRKSAVLLDVRHNLSRHYTSEPLRISIFHDTIVTRTPTRRRTRIRKRSSRGTSALETGGTYAAKNVDRCDTLSAAGSQMTILTLDEAGSQLTGERRMSRLSLVSLLSAPKGRRWRPSLLLAILGLQDAQVRWISKDRVGYCQSSDSDLIRSTASYSVESDALEILPEVSKDSGNIIHLEPEIENRKKKSWRCVLKAVKGSMTTLFRQWSERAKPTYRSEERDTPLWDKNRMNKWQLLQHCVTTLFTFQLLSPTKGKGHMPLKQLGGRFRDLKVERWYLSWSSSIEAFIIIKMRTTLIALTVIEICTGIGQLIVHRVIATSSKAPDASEIAFLWLSASVNVCQVLLSIRIFYQLRPQNFGDHTTSHLFKLRATTLAGVMVITSIVDYFSNPSNTVFHVDDLTPTQEMYLVVLQSLKEINLHSALIAFPIFCLCTESVMANFVIIFSIVLFIAAPLISSYSDTWPILTLGSVVTLQKTLLFAYAPPNSEVQQAATRAEAFWTHYFTLFHQFAPCLVVQYVLSRAVQGTLRRLFGRNDFLYLLYLDAFAPLDRMEGFEEHMEDHIPETKASLTELPSISGSGRTEEISTNKVEAKGTRTDKVRSEEGGSELTESEEVGSELTESEEIGSELTESEVGNKSTESEVGSELSEIEGAKSNTATSEGFQHDVSKASSSGKIGSKLSDELPPESANISTGIRSSQVEDVQKKNTYQPYADLTASKSSAKPKLPPFKGPLPSHRMIKWRS